MLLLLPAVLAAGLFAWLRFGVEDLLRPFRTMGEGCGRGGSLRVLPRGDRLSTALGGSRQSRPPLLPAPLILLAARAVSAARAGVAWGFLLLAALPGAFATLVLVVPSSPAQDWDLLAIVLLPAALAVTAAGIPALERVSPRATAGILLIATAGLRLRPRERGRGRRIRRFESLVGETRRSGRTSARTETRSSPRTGRTAPTSGAFTHARRAVDAEPSNPRLGEGGGASSRWIATRRRCRTSRRRCAGSPAAGTPATISGSASRRRVGLEAVAAFRTAVAADGDRPDYRHNLGLMLYAAGKPDSARLVWSEVLRRWEGTRSRCARWSGASMERRFGTEANVDPGRHDLPLDRSPRSCLVPRHLDVPPPPRPPERAGHPAARGGRLRLAARTIVGVPLFWDLLYIANPAWMSWASIALPVGLRWAGAVLGVVLIPAMVWSSARWGGT